MADALPLIQTKLHQPPLPRDLVARPRLTNLLDRPPQRPLTLISAPAGYGKSTLIASWAEVLDCSVAWVSLDERDSDIVIFVSYFLAALQSSFPDVGTHTWALIQSPEIPAVRLITNTLINEIHQIEESIVLILDDYYMIRSTAIHDFLEGLLTHPSPYLHLVIITRVDPPLSLSKLRARETQHAVVIINLRKSENLGSTFLQVLDRYAADLQRQDSLLMLAGVLPRLVEQLEKTGLLRRIGRENVFVEGEVVGQSVLAAWEVAERWIADATQQVQG